MPSHVALLYSIVLTPTRRVVMTDLKAAAEAAGLQNVETLLATGNLVFDAGDLAVPAVEAALESTFQRKFGKPVDIIVRDAAAFKALVAANPFPAQSAEDGSRVITRIMRSGVPSDAETRLRSLLDEGERVAVIGGDIWAAFPARPSASRLLSAISSKKLGIGTARNWNTIQRLAVRLSPAP
ncbi:hypothetical protein C3941_04660 [Kaistia algarum]|uniref:DUF1697 domain-containing protein n=1 Tax=Kaistia algarum TaxID=2083279 RepID=UPI000CE7EBFC|nr:DUF1697 domain-containing protein [Kaistia algarum]MCX5512491.1 DUF1697 domain-containing protein [Kaistia algarum]PPE81972.1 hypothetical protein C3941_04660 [Kaistia algarum]